MSDKEKPGGDEPKAKNKRGPGKMTRKQRNLVQALIGPAKGNVSEGGRIAGYSNAPTAHRAMKKIGVRFTDYLEKHGMDDDYLAEKCIKPALEAMETKSGWDKGVAISKIPVIIWDR